MTCTPLSSGSYPRRNGWIVPPGGPTRKARMFQPDAGASAASVGAPDGPLATLAGRFDTRDGSPYHAPLDFPGHGPPTYNPPAAPPHFATPSCALEERPMPEPLKMVYEKDAP